MREDAIYRVVGALEADPQPLSAADAARACRRRKNAGGVDRGKTTPLEAGTGRRGNAGVGGLCGGWFFIRLVCKLHAPG